MQIFYKRLLNGDAAAFDTIVKGGKFFEGYFAGKSGWNAAQFAQDLGHQQTAFEHAIGGDRFDAKMLMPFAALGELYSDEDGFDNRAPLAREVIKGFLQSSVSLEVKSAAATAARDYGLDADGDEALQKAIDRN